MYSYPQAGTFSGVTVPPPGFLRNQTGFCSTPYDMRGLVRPLGGGSPGLPEQEAGFAGAGYYDAPVIDSNLDLPLLQLFPTLAPLQLIGDGGTQAAGEGGDQFIAWGNVQQQPRGGGAVGGGGGAGMQNHALSGPYHSDVDVAVPATGDVLNFNGTKWVAVSSAGKTKSMVFQLDGNAGSPEWDSVRAT